MPASLQQLQTQRDALAEARLRGVTTVRDQSGEMITYRTDSEMAAALAAADREIARLKFGRAPSILRFSTTKGLW